LIGHVLAPEIAALAVLLLGDCDVFVDEGSELAVPRCTLSTQAEL
jgi:hypothetical protein